VHQRCHRGEVDAGAAPDVERVVVRSEVEGFEHRITDSGPLAVHPRRTALRGSRPVDRVEPADIDRWSRFGTHEAP
jgi:hypothetical protein